MDTRTQQLIIGILGLSLIGLIIKDETNYAMYILMILATALTGKSLTEKQGEVLEEQMQEQVQNEVKGIVTKQVNNKIDNMIDEHIDNIINDE